ncbi:hypothetical protein ACFLYR_03825 [Chloroflexota bacterium]
MPTQSEEQKKQWGVTGVAIPTGLLIGLGIGFLIDNITAGILLGLGGGFLVMFIDMLILQLKRRSTSEAVTRKSDASLFARGIILRVRNQTSRYVPSG